MVFFLCIMRARTHKFAAKKTQGKNRTMQRHEQVLPPCHCIARIDAGEYVRADAIECRWGVGGGSNRQNWQVSTSQQTSLAETAFSFWSFVFESAGSSLKKKKEGRQQDRESDFGRN
jgi:hypothetical protein